MLRLSRAFEGRAIWAAPLLGALVLLVAACSGGGDAAEPTTTPAPSAFGPGSGGFAGLDLDSLATCMAAAGFEFDAEANPAEMFRNSDAGAADQLRACAEEQGTSLPDSGFPEGGPPANFDGAGGQGLIDCLREAGIDVDEATGAGGAGGPLGGLDRSDPEVQEALQACGAPAGNGP